MNLLYDICKHFYIPLCRTYAKYILGNQPADRLVYFLSTLDFLLIHSYWPHLKNPLSFSGKVYNRMLYDRSYIWTVLSDKLLARDYIVNKIGNEHLIPLLWKGENPDEIPFDDLPSKFVIKTNHGCHYNIIVKDKTELDQIKTKRQLKKWLCENYCEDTSLGIEWAYKNVRPFIIIESFIDNNGNVPWDYKFFCFSGRMEFFKIDFDRFENHTEKFFDRDLNGLDFFEQGFKQYEVKIDLPDNFKDMVRVAESLSEGFDFIRVDLYNTNGKVYIGELTCYPGAGRMKFIPKEYDFLFGEKWITA